MKQYQFVFRFDLCNVVTSIALLLTSCFPTAFFWYFGSNSLCDVVYQPPCCLLVFLSESYCCLTLYIWHHHWIPNTQSCLQHDGSQCITEAPGLVHGNAWNMHKPCTWKMHERCTWCAHKRCMKLTSSVRGPWYVWKVVKISKFWNNLQLKLPLFASWNWKKSTVNQYFFPQRNAFFVILNTLIYVELEYTETRLHRTRNKVSSFYWQLKVRFEIMQKSSSSKSGNSWWKSPQAQSLVT